MFVKQHVICLVAAQCRGYKYIYIKYHKQHVLHALPNKTCAAFNIC